MAKKTKQKNRAEAQKHTIKTEGYSSDKEKVVWRFDMIDRSGKFAFNPNGDSFKCKDFLEKLIDYSSMTWTEVKKQTHDDGKSKHHFLSPQFLSPEAAERLKAKQLEEYSDSIFSFALDNKLRLVGIRKNEDFHVLWYDPEHEVCPSKKKHT